MILLIIIKIPIEKLDVIFNNIILFETLSKAIEII